MPRTRQKMMPKTQICDWDYVVINPRGIASDPLSAAEALRLHAIHGYLIAALVCPYSMTEPPPPTNRTAAA